MENNSNKKSEGFFKSSPISKKGRISYLLSQPFPKEEIILGKTKDQVLRFLYKGFQNPNAIAREISKERKIARTTVKQHLEELEKINLVFFEKDDSGKKKYAAPYNISEKGRFLIEKSVGFPVKSSHKRQLRESDLKTYTNAGHGYIYAIKPDKKINFKKCLEDSKIDYILKTNAKVPRIIFNGKKIWLNDTQNKITVWFPKDERHFHKTPLKSRASAEKELFEDMEDLMDKFKINFTYRFKNTRVHNGDISDERAKHFKSKKRSVFVYDDKGEWLRYDFSHKTPEREVTRDDKDLNVATAFQKFENINKRDGFLTARPDNLKKKFKEIDGEILENKSEIKERIKELSKQNLQLSQVLEQVSNNVVHLTKIVIKDKKD